MAPAAQALLPQVVATGTVEGVFKPIDCETDGTVAFEVDVGGDDGRMDLTPTPNSTACAAIGTQVTLWVNFCDGGVGERIVCGDDDLNTTEIATAILEADGAFAYADDDWHVEGDLVRGGGP